MKSKLTPELQEKIIKYIEAGNYTNKKAKLINGKT